MGGGVAIASDTHRGISRISLYAATALVAQLAVLIIWITRYFVVREPNAPMLAWDFRVFWSAARVALEHGASAVFSPDLMYAMESSVANVDGVALWAYPPTFLLAVIPLGMLSFTAAYAVFACTGAACYALMLKHLVHGIDRERLVFLAAFPGVTVTLLAGQNSLFTVAAAGCALALLPAHFMLAAVCIASFAIKPQLAVLFPLVLLCSGQWKTLIAAGALTLAFAATSVAILGRDAWAAFAAFLPVFSRLVVEEGGRLWAGMPTVFAMSRIAGLSTQAAYLVQALVAIPAIGVVALLWVRQARYELRAAALVVATMLVQPYFMYYELCWLILPILFLIRDGKLVALNRIEWAILVAAWLAPAQGMLAVGLRLPFEIAPVVMIAMLGMIVRRYAMTLGRSPASPPSSPRVPISTVGP